MLTDEDGIAKRISFRERTAEKILSGIEASKQAPFERTLYAIGIRFVGETIAKKLARSFKNIDTLSQATFDELIAVDEIGDRIAASVIDFFSQSDNQEMIVRLKQAGLQFAVDETAHQVKSEALKNKSIVVSGVFSIPRDDIKKMVEEHGGKNSGSISSKTDYVLAGEKMGHEKLKKAETLSIPIISEEDFYQLIGK